MTKMRVLLFSFMTGLLLVTVSVAPSYSWTGRTTGVRHVALVMMRQPNTCDKLHKGCPKTWSVADAKRTMGVGKFAKRHGSVTDWFTKASGGQLRIVPKVYGYWNAPGAVAYTDPYTAKGNPHACNKNWWFRAAKSQGAQHHRGFKPSKFDTVIIWAPRVHDQLGHQYCGFDGVASVGGNVVFLNGTHNLRTIVHELGHNMGLGHAGYFTCGRIDANCLSAYGDPTDLMGCQKCGNYFNADHKYQLGWIKNKNVQTIKDGVVIVRVIPSENPKRSDSQTELVMIPRDSKSYYSVEFRHDSGYDRKVTGVWIRLVSVMDGTWKGTRPGADDTELFRKTSWKQGETFSSTVNAVTIKILRVDGGGANLQVCVGPCEPPPVTATNEPVTDPPPTFPPATDPPATESPTSTPIITDPPVPDDPQPAV